MTHPALDAIARAIAALTYPEIERIETGADGRLQVTRDAAVPLLHRSIAQDLLQIERVIGARGQTLLSANAAAIDEALVAIEEARALIAAPGSANVKPAPFAMTESVVRSLIDPEAPAGPRTVAVPVEPAALVDRPKRSEDPRLAKANDDVPEVSSEAVEAVAAAALAKVGLDNPSLPVTVHVSTSSEPGSGRAPATVKKPRRGKTPPPAADPARKADVMHRQAKDRDARELEQPVDRMTMIRSAAQKLALPAQTGDFRAVMGARAPKPAATVPPLPAFARRQRLQAAVMHLKRQCILVSPVDRAALVMRYRVSGKKEAMYAEDVIAFAAELGFEIEGGQFAEGERA